MSEEKVQETVQENLDIKVENKPESADSGLLQEVMSKKATIKELQAKLDEHNTAQEKARQKQLSEDGKKDELIAELNTKVDKLEGEYTRLSKYEDDEKTNLIASIASDATEAEQLENESLSTLRLLKNKIASATPETPTPTARGSVGNQPPPEDWTNMDERTRRKNWGNILKSFKN
jgi:predicted transcriptional regulator